MTALSLFAGRRIEFFVPSYAQNPLVKSGKGSGVTAAPSPKNRACDFRRTRLKPLLTPREGRAEIRRSRLHDTHLGTNHVAVWRAHGLAPSSAIPSSIALSGSLVTRHLGKSARFRVE